MDSGERERIRRLEVYAHDTGTSLERKVGFGASGTVVETMRHTAIKAHDIQATFERERNAYLRLRRKGMREICGCMVPLLIDFSDELLVIEMTVVTPPFVLDFGAAYVDQRPDYSAETIAEAMENEEELFGEDWPEMQRIRSALIAVGIFYYDAHPANVRLR